MRKLICQGCGQEFTPMPRSESKTLCPKCFINKLNGLVAKSDPGNSGDDPAQNKTMDQPTDPQQPKPTAPDAPVETPATPLTGEEPAETPAPGAPTPAPGAPAPEGEEEKEEGGETPVGGETSPPPAA